MKLFIFSGFLGSGKTMSIISFAKYLMSGGDQSSVRQRLVIIENEIGDAAFDESVLKDDGLEVKNMLSGCICCTLNADLIQTLMDVLQKYDPDYVVFEPTGLAFPDRIANSVKEVIKDIDMIRTVAVADAERWDVLAGDIPKLINAQVREADIVLLNKTDLVDEKMLVEIRKGLEKMNEHALIFPIVARDGVEDVVWEAVTDYVH